VCGDLKAQGEDVVGKKLFGSGTQFKFTEPRLLSTRAADEQLAATVVDAHLVWGEREQKLLNPV